MPIERRIVYVAPVSMTRSPWFGPVAVLLVVVGAVGVVAIAQSLQGGSQPRQPAAASPLRLPPDLVARGRIPAAATGTTASALAAGDYSTCAVLRRGAVQCWGDDSYGQLGNATRVSASVPVPVSGPEQGIRQLAAGGVDACELLRTGRIECWGANRHGQLGNGTLAALVAPAPVHGIRAATAVAVGGQHACAVLRGGGVECWGANADGELGDGTRTDARLPVRTTGLRRPARSVTAGLAHTCVLLAGGSVECWGSNANGELGNGTMVDSPTPVAVHGLAAPAVAIDAGDAHTCALLRTGAVQCWGWNIEGQLGDGGGSDSATPVSVSGLARAIAIAAGGSHTCALVRSGSVRCWGANLYGQLGNGTTSDSAVPVAASGLGSGVSAIAAGLYHSCALLTGGSVSCWGWNAQGQLGNGTTSGSPAPVGVAGLGLAPDGSGSVMATPRSLAASARRTTITFSFTVAPGGIHDGAFAVTVPPGWRRPSTKPLDPGYSTASAGHVLTVGRTISVTGLTLASRARLTIVYGSTAGGGPGVKPRPAAAAVWRAREQSSPSGNLSSLAISPVIHVLSADGTGEVATKSTVVSNGAVNRNVVFDYVAAPGGVADGAVRLTVPPGWSAPTTVRGAAGSVSANAGSVSVTGRKVTVSGLTLGGGDQVRIAYGHARAPSTTVGYQSWDFDARSSASGSFRALASSPSIQVLAPSGAGNVYGFQTSVANGARGVHLTFTYQAGAGGIRGGSLTLEVPPGWSPPSTSRRDPGYVTSSAGKPTVHGRLIHLQLDEVSSYGSLQIEYGASKGALAPRSNLGAQDWTFAEAAGDEHPKRLASQPSVTVISSDGSGSLRRASGPVSPGSSGNTVVFLFQAAPGGIQDGTLTLTVPDGWSGPATDGGDAGYVVATAGSIAMSGQTITLSHVYLASGSTMSIIYGSRTGNGPGASAPKHVGPMLWSVAEESTPTGTLRRLRG
jgi:alpha-tubulin suppressor-like RCC1 family protein